LLGGKPRPSNPLDGRQRSTETGQVVVDQGRKQLHQDQVRHAFSIAFRGSRELFEGPGLVLSAETPSGRGDCNYVAPMRGNRQSSDEGGDPVATRTPPTFNDESSATESPGANG
jgi:hypothetical protein